VRLPWLNGREPRSSVLGEDFFRRDAVQVARDLLGVRLVSTVDGQECSGVLVEVEAYLGADDPASHAATRGGVTERNRAMFGPAGRAYIYRSYGMHWCLNVVTGREGDGQAVLLRGLEPLSGLEVMRERRQGGEPLAAGPGRLAQALGVTGELYGHDLTRGPLELRPGWILPDAAVEVSGRVGVGKVPEWPLRFYIRGSRGVSRSRAHPGAPALPSHVRR
jgi:DNA-3-methyladenine glycosylase